MDDLSDLPPLEPYNKKRQSKEEPNMPKVLPSSPEKKAEVAKIFPDMNNLSNNFDKSNGASLNNTSKQFPNSASSMMRENQVSRADVRKNRTQRASKVDKQHRLVEELDDKELARGRRMISSMINTAGTKNMITDAQTSIETINKNIQELNKQIQNVQESIYEIDYLIANDPNNSDLEKRRKELISFSEALETTNRLYKEQIDMRTENKSLLEKIHKLKQENMEIKGRVIEGLEKIQGHMHNLPCERQKSALIELQKVRKQLQRERKMREDLENKVQNTIQDFSRLYEEADLARKIIVGKLQKLEITEEQLDCGFITIDQLSRLNPAANIKQSMPKSIDTPPHAHLNIPSNANLPNFSRVSGYSQLQDRSLEPSALSPNMSPKPNKSYSKQSPKELQDNTIRRDSNVRNRNLADKVGLMRGNMQTFKKMKF